MGIVRSHIELARAELSEIADEVKRVAVLGSIAIGAALIAGILLPVGGALFLGEWLFGSLGWGVLLGTELLVVLAVVASLIALGADTGTFARAFIVAAAAGIAAGVPLGLNLTNRAWTIAAETFLPRAPIDIRPLLIALMVLPTVLGLLFGIAGSLINAASDRSMGDSSDEWETPSLRSAVIVALPASALVGWLAAFVASYSGGLEQQWALVVAAIATLVAAVLLATVGRTRIGGRLIAGLSLGAILGAVLGALTAIAIGPRVAVAIGVAVGLGALPAVLGASIARRGIDVDDLKARFWPTQTIETTKETIEWLREQTPLGPRQ